MSSKNTLQFYAHDKRICIIFLQVAFFCSKTAFMQDLCNNVNLGPFLVQSFALASWMATNKTLDLFQAVRRRGLST